MMDTLGRFFQLFDRMFNQSSWKAAFGEPQHYQEKAIIPVAMVTYGFGMGVGTPAARLAQETTSAAEPAQPDGPADDEGGSGGGGGGGVTPIALIEVTPQRVVVRPIIRWERVILAFIFMVCWTTFFGTATARKALEHEGCERCS